MVFQNRKFALGVSTAVLVLAVLPYLLAYFFTGQDQVFSGPLLNPIDGNTYFAKAYQGWRGDWRFRLPYTAEPGAGAMINLYYLFIGHIARWTGLSIHFVYHAARLAGAAALLYALQHFYGRTLADRFQQNTALALSALGLGLGWLAVPFNYVTADFWVAETFPLLAVLTNPHFPLGLALILWLATPRVSTSVRRLAIYAALSFLLGLISPFGVVIAVLPWSGQMLADLADRLRKRRFSFAGMADQPPYQAAAAILLGGAPVLIYDWLAIRADPVLAAWDAQNLTTTPPWWDLLLSFSPAFILAFLGLRRAPASLVSWFSLGLVLVFIPFALQRRFMMGLYIPIAGLGAVGFERLRGKTRTDWLAPLMLALLVLPGTLLLAMSAIFGVLSRSDILFLTRNEANGLAWIAADAPADALVLASPEMGLYIPAWTGRRVLYGHPFETVAAVEREAEVTAVFQEADSQSFSNYLYQHEVDYVFFGPREEALRPQGLDEVPGLRRTLTSGSVSVYEVLK